MSELYRLRELAALFQKPIVVEKVEESKGTAGFAGIMRIVDDALNDLHDKLGEGGALEALLDKVGLTDLDKNKDGSGSTILESLAAKTTAYKKAIEHLMTEVELMLASDVSEGLEDLTEMAKPHEFHRGVFDRKTARQLIKDFRDGEETFDIGNDSYKAVKTVSGAQLEAGMIVFASHDSTNTGAELYLIKGFTDGSSDEPVYKSVKDAISNTGASNLASLEKEDVKLVVKDMHDGDEGPFFYLYKGAWSYGSGAERLSFKLVQKV